METSFSTSEIDRLVLEGENALTVGELTEAALFFTRALQLIESTQSLSGAAENSKAVRVLFGLGTAYRRSGWIWQALCLLHRAYYLALAAETSHGRLANDILCDLARCYLNIDRCDDAIHAIETLIADCEQNSEVKADKAYCHWLLGESYIRKEDYRQAELNYLMALELEQVGDNDASSVAYILFLLCWSQEACGEFLKAEEYARRCMGLLQTAFPANHEYISAAYSLFARVKTGMKEFSESEQMHDAAVAIRVEKFGSDHPFTVVLMAQLARFHADHGQDTQAIEEWNKVHQSAVRNADLEDQIKALKYLAQLHQKNRQLKMAEKLLVEALEISHRDDNVKKERPAQVLLMLARLAKQQRDWLKAEFYFSEAIEFNNVVYVKDCDFAAQSYLELSEVLVNLGKISESRKHLRQSMQILKNIKASQDHETYLRAMKLKEKIAAFSRDRVR